MLNYIEIAGRYMYSEEKKETTGSRCVGSGGEECEGSGMCSGMEQRHHLSVISKDDGDDLDGT